MKERDVVGEAIAEDAADKAAAGVRRWQMVPVEPTEEMMRAGWHCLREKNDFQTRLGNSLAGTETPVYRAMLAAAPQPPALGGEPEVLGHIVTDMNGDSYLAFDRQTPADRELIDRAHLAPLLAEIKRLKEAKVLVEIAASSVVAAKADIERENERLTARNAELESAVALDDRMEFEAWADQKGFCLDSAFFAEGNNFIDDDTRLAFDIWMARAALNKPAGVQS